MNSTITRRCAGCLAILVATVGLFVLSGCGSGTGQQVASNNKQANVTSDNQGNAIARNSPSQTLSPSTTTGDVPQTGETQKRGTQDSDNRQAARFPTPQIGTGGSDFFLFTQARAAVLADTEFKTANITIDVRAGALTLSGNVANAAQKARAEQLVRAVSGIKSVNNQLRISNRQST